MPYKIYHKPSNTFWKGGGMRKNNGSRSYIKSTDSDGKYCYREYDKKSEQDALKICFSKKGKIWEDMGCMNRALKYGHEEGLENLLKKCVLIEYSLDKKVKEHF